MSKPKSEADVQTEALAKVEARPRRKLHFSYFDQDELELAKGETGDFEVLNKSILTRIDSLKRGQKVTQKVFEEDPSTFAKYRSYYKPKPQELIPDWVLKRIAVRNELVAAILLARGNQLSAFGYPLEDRHSCGFRIDLKKGVDLTPEQKSELAKRIKEATRTLASCGFQDVVQIDDRMSLAEFLRQQGRNATLFGRHATNVEYDEQDKFLMFRPVDVGTIYEARPDSDQALENLRELAFKYLVDSTGNKDLKPEVMRERDFKYVQVINFQPRQAFTANEMLVENIYSVTDIEMMGYPLTPIDQAIDSIMTHMNIGTHNKLYFQSGRAAKGMVVIKSDDVDPAMVASIKEHFNASINSVGNSHRVPVFGIGSDPNETISWQPLEMQGARDQEFQYLADSNARAILSSFMMAPEELPGYGHLSKGTNSQALSEEDNEYKLEAARDTGIRPLVKHFQDFLNERILPLIDKTLADICVVKLIGLEQDTPEKENARIQTEQPLHGTYDETLGIVEKKPIGRAWGGDIPLNPGVQGVWDKYLTVGEIQEFWLGKSGAAKDPKFQYLRDPFYFNFLQLQMQKEQMAQQQQQMQAQAQQQQQQQAAPPPQDGQKPEGGDELASSIDQATELLGKSEQTLPADKRRILAQHRATVDHVMTEWEKEAQEALAQVLQVAKYHKPKKA